MSSVRRGPINRALPANKVSPADSCRQGLLCLPAGLTLKTGRACFEALQARLCWQLFWSLITTEGTEKKWYGSDLGKESQRFLNHFHTTLHDANDLRRFWREQDNRIPLPFRTSVRIVQIARAGHVRIAGRNVCAAALHAILFAQRDRFERFRQLTGTPPRSPVALAAKTSQTDRITERRQDRRLEKPERSPFDSRFHCPHLFRAIPWFSETKPILH